MVWTEFFGEKKFSFFMRACQLSKPESPTMPAEKHGRPG
jgi:hypothetical protein